LNVKLSDGGGRAMTAPSAGEALTSEACAQACGACASAASSARSNAAQRTAATSLLYFLGSSFSPGAGSG